MAKMYKKSDLKFVDGYVLTQEDEVVALPDGIAEQINDLETFLQEMAYIKAQPEAAPVPDLVGFERKSIVETPSIQVDTPALDEMEERSRRVLEDLRNREGANAVNRVLEKYADTLVFLSGERFVEGSKVVRVDTPVIGDILKVTGDEMIDLIANYSGLYGDDEE